MNNILPTVFHITHWKAGSQWVAEILRQCAPGRFIPWIITDARANGGLGISSFRLQPLIPGKIYGTLYVNRRRFQHVTSSFVWAANEWISFGRRAAFSNWWNYGIRRSPYRSFLLIRDLRDTLVSFYFSIRFSHKTSPAIMVSRKRKLNQLNEEDGLTYLLDEVLADVAAIQTSWIGAPGVPVLRYEEILGNEQAVFERLVDHCQIPVGRERLAGIVRNNMFDAVTGRNRGQEDVNAHLRKGIAGDWRNHFSERVRVEFQRRYGQLLVDTGYERDFNW